MSIHRTYGKVIFECDSCGEELETGEEQFADALAKAKHEGWKTRRDMEGEWENLCDVCTEGEDE